MKLAGALVAREQRAHLARHLRVVRLDRGEALLAFGRRRVEELVEELVDVAPARGVHAESSRGEPRARDGPVPLDRGGGDVHRLGGLLDGQAAEEAQLDEPRLLGVDRLEPLQRLVEGDEIDAAGCRRRAGLRRA